MPTYQYTCKECGEQVEVVQKFTDDPLTVCPACGGVLRKVFSPVGIVFKGSGFYRTDSRKGSSSDIPAKDKEPAGAKADSKSGASKDSGSAGSGSSDSSASSSGSGSGSSGSGSSGSSGSGSSGSSGSSDSSSSASSGKNGSKSSAPAASA